MAIDNGYVTLAQLKAHMGKPSAVTTNDTLYENSIENASREIDKAITGRRDYVVFKEHVLDESQVRAGFGFNADCVALNYSRRRLVFTDKIAAITAIVDNGVTLTSGTDYFVGDDFIEAAGSFTSDLENGVLISGTISSDIVPDEIRSLCLNMAEVLTGMSTMIVTDSGGNDVEIRLKNYPDWVVKKLKSFKKLM